MLFAAMCDLPCQWRIGCYRCRRCHLLPEQAHRRLAQPHPARRFQGCDCLTLQPLLLETDCPCLKSNPRPTERPAGFSPAHGAMRAHGDLSTGADMDEVGGLSPTEGHHNRVLALQQHGLQAQKQPCHSCCYLHNGIELPASQTPLTGYE